MSECTPDELAFSAQEQRGSPDRLHCLTRGQAIGLTIRVESGLVSLIAVIVVYLLVLRNVWRHYKAAPRGTWRLLEGPADIYMIALFAFDFLQSFGRSLDSKWIKEGKVYTGAYCDAAGSIQQVGETGSAQITLAIAVHTFITIWCERGARARLVAFATVAAVCVYTSVYVGVGLARNKGTGHPYDAPAPYWCWIGPDNQLLAERITGEYMWLWITLIVSVLLYVPMYFLTRGNITIPNPRKPWRFSVHARREGYVPTSVGMLAYPLVYAITILPLSVGRWYGFTEGNSVPSAVTFTVSSLYGLNGLFNVLLLFARPQVLLFNSPDPSTRAAHARRPTAGALPHSRSPTPSPMLEKPSTPAARRRGAPPRGLPDADSDSEDEGRGVTRPEAVLPAMRSLTREQSRGGYDPYAQADTPGGGGLPLGRVGSRLGAEGYANRSVV